MRHLSFEVLLIALMGTPAFTSNAAIQGGVGVPSVTHGRTVPSAYVGALDKNGGFTFHTGGVRTEFYYHNFWQCGLYNYLGKGGFIWGETEYYLGWSAAFNMRGYKPDPLDSKLENAKEYAVGPSIRGEWYFLGNAYIGVEGMMGLSYSSLRLNFQHSSFLILGLAL